MATDSAARSVTNTLTGTTADTITLTQGWEAVAVTNHDATDVVYFRTDGTTAVAAANDTIPVLPGTTVIRAVGTNTSGQIVVSVVGDGGAYTVEGVQ